MITEGRRARMGTAMIGRDYAHWHGLFEPVQDTDKIVKEYNGLNVIRNRSRRNRIGLIACLFHGEMNKGVASNRVQEPCRAPGR